MRYYSELELKFYLKFEIELMLRQYRRFEND
jgi:hypothetical protein